MALRHTAHCYWCMLVFLVLSMAELAEWAGYRSWVFNIARWVHGIGMSYQGILNN